MVVHQADHTMEKYIKIEDGAGFDVKHFNLPKHYEDSIERVLIPRGLILDRIEKMARDIHEEMKTDSLVVLCILKGAVGFSQDLMQFINNLNRNSGRSIQVTMEFVRVKSYKNMESGDVSITGHEGLNIKGKDVLIVEDLIDTGKTMVNLLAALRALEPKSIKVSTLLIKRRPNSIGYKPDYCGFEVPDEFVVGYVIDYNERFRDLSHICIINEHGKKKYSVE